MTDHDKSLWQDGLPITKLSYEKIYEIVRRIPKGKVATYGQIAMLAGNERGARVVGNALHHNPDGEETPCYRVVNGQGYPSKAFVFGGIQVQVERLKKDGVEFVNGHVDMKRYLWNPYE